MNDKEIILRAKETPQKLKDSYHKLIKKMEKMNVKLTPDGNVCIYKPD
jgi:hypothetical protein